MHRQPDHVMTFLLAELGTSGLLDGQQRLAVKGLFAPKNFEVILHRYISKYFLNQILCLIYSSQWFGLLQWKQEVKAQGLDSITLRQTLEEIIIIRGRDGIVVLGIHTCCRGLLLFSLLNLISSLCYFQMSMLFALSAKVPTQYFQRRIVSSFLIVRR